ncbi:BRO family protein [Clostridium perfringens]|uniref:BRO family protein n=1 Tax=Clostridium perfringens TaxID=1502 RepID=UPI001A1E3320|nr:MULTISPECIES: BRO family protein [Clostridium]MDO6232055.1 BRO family protein [Clostridium perfringens]MDY4720930.1 BRO family protein [Clostridium paraputrificum]WDT38187.1 BRO family protein [Clostridium perfringens]HAT4325901.1 hypothetical protein [Clostridium perfringens]
MNNLMIFKNEKFGVIKTIVKEGEPLFLANPLAEILGYSKTNGMVKRLDDDEKNRIFIKRGWRRFGVYLK